MLAHEVINDGELEIEDYLDGIADDTPFANREHDHVIAWKEFERERDRVYDVPYYERDGYSGNAA